MMMRKTSILDEVSIASKVSSLQNVIGCIVRKLAGFLKDNVTLREIIRERAIIKNTKAIEASSASSWLIGLLPPTWT